MNIKLRKQIRAGKRRIEKRLQTPANGSQTPELNATNIHYEISDRQQAVTCGGIGLIHQMVNKLELAESINRDVPLLQLYLPYAESDHVLNMAYNLSGRGTCVWNILSIAATTKLTSTRWARHESLIRQPPVTSAAV